MHKFCWRLTNSLIIFTFLAPLCSAGQVHSAVETILMQAADTALSRISLQTTGGLQTQALPVSFGLGWLRGGNIDSEIDESLKNAWPRTRGQGMATARLDALLARSDSNHLWLSFRAAGFIWGNASRDAFSLVFEGTAGVERASMKREFLTQAVHWQVGVGKVYGRNGMAWSLNAGLITEGFIFEANNATFNRKGFNTGPTGATSNWNVDGQVSLTQFSSPSPTLSLSFHKMLVNDSKLKLLFSANDLGIGYLLQAEKLETNSGLSFSGVSTEELFNLSGFADSLLQALPDTVQVNSVIGLPAHFALHTEARLSEKTVLTGQFSYRLAVTAIPETVVGLKYRITPAFQVNPYLGYGGFTNFFGGLGLSGNFNQWLIQLHASDARGLTSTSQSGLMMQAQLDYVF